MPGIFAGALNASCKPSLDKVISDLRHDLGALICNLGVSLAWSAMPLQTELEFTVPKGYVDEEGTLHRKGVMRRATAADEILPLKDPRAQRNSAYLSILVLSRVIVKLGSLPLVTPKTIENLYASDLAYLQEFYNKINRAGSKIKATCPKCKKQFEVETGGEN